MVLRKLAVAIGLTMALAAAPAGARDEPDGRARILTFSGYVSTWDPWNGAWFELAQEDARFELPASSERGTHLELLDAAARRGVALRIRFDVAAGRFDEANGRLVFPLCSLAAPGGPSFGDERANCPPGARRASEAERLLALGFAQRQEQPDAARRTIGAALAATPALPPQAQAIAYRSRALASEARSYEVAAGPERDRFLSDALADYRRVAALRADDGEAQVSVGVMLQGLGAYPEALAAFRALGEAPLGRAFLAAVQISALQRQQEDYAGALATLDEFARAHPDEADGMRFHYHRARALALLGRNDEALAAIDRGMATQGDYPYAMLLRACVRGRLGQIGDAIADEERGRELLGAILDRPSEDLVRDMARSRSVIASLRAAAAHPAPTAVACEGFWDESDHPRPRSALLDQAPRAPR